jgi:hypothetical protein
LTIFYYTFLNRRFYIIFTPAPTVVAFEDIGGGPEGRGMGRIRLKSIPDASSESILSFIDNHVSSGSCIRTIEWEGFDALEEKRYEHVVVGPEELYIVDRIFLRLKKWLWGTYKGAVQPHQLDYYLDEFTFRFNHRNSAVKGELFYYLLKQAVATAPVPGHQIIGGCSGHEKV